MHIRSPPLKIQSVCSTNMTLNFRRMPSVSGANHGLDDNLVRHLVAVKEQFVLQLLAQAEEAKLGNRGTHFRHLTLITFFKVKGLDLFN